MDRRIRVGVVGLGFMGKQHLGAYFVNPQKAEVIAVADLDESKLTGDLSNVGGNIADKSGAKIDLSNAAKYTKIEDLIADPNVELVDITLPTNLHQKYAVMSFEAKKHVLCEKPMALTIKECDSMIDAAKKARKKFMVAHCLRFWPEYAWTREQLKVRRYGKVRAAHFTRLAAIPGWSWKNWLLQTKVSGGAIMDLHIHDVDFIQYLFGKPEAVYAHGVAGHAKGCDHVVCIYDFKSPILVSAEAGWDLPPSHPFEMGFRILCDDATIFYSCAKSPTITVYRNDGSVEVPEITGPDGYFLEINEFLDSIIENKAPKTVTPKDARSAVEICLAEVKSIETGKKVKLSL